jgi:hypothetical protein
LASTPEPYDLDAGLTGGAKRSATTSQATELFEERLDWQRVNYPHFRFFVERDVVWTTQLHLSELIQAGGQPYRVFNDYPILPGSRRSLCTDIALLNQQGEVEVAAEFKFEPSYQRTDIWPTKFPVVFWDEDGVLGDVQRVNRFVDKRAARTAYALFIDEGGALRHRPPHPGSEWIGWPTDPAHHSCSVGPVFAGHVVGSPFAAR